MARSGQLRKGRSCGRDKRRRRERRKVEDGRRETRNEKRETGKQETGSGKTGKRFRRVGPERMGPSEPEQQTPKRRASGRKLDGVPQRAAAPLGTDAPEAVGRAGRGSRSEELAGRATSASTALLNIPPPYCRPGRRRSQRSKTKGWGYSRPEGWASDEARCHSDASHSGKEVSPS